MLNAADFDTVYAEKPNNVEEIPCKPPACFVGSYAPVAKPGQDGPFFVNSYLLQSDRKFETLGTVKVRASDVNKCRK